MALTMSLSGAFVEPLRRALLCSRRAYHASIIPSLISSANERFNANANAMDVLVQDLDAKMSVARLGGGARAAERMKSKGKKLPRER
jgi:3-methylcrotonyl-CoA carboxylase beta subunit